MPCLNASLKKMTAWLKLQTWLIIFDNIIAGKNKAWLQSDVISWEAGVDDLRAVSI